MPDRLKVGLTTSPHKNITVTQPQGDKARQFIGLRHGKYKGKRTIIRSKDLFVGNWNVLSPYRAGALKTPIRTVG